MKRVISFHSSRGGTGKTIIAVNVAALLAGKGMNTALIDLDFRAPSLFHIFKEARKEPTGYWINDYLNSRCRPDDILIDVHKTFNLKGNLLVAFANPSIRSVEDMLGKSRGWEAKALRKLLNLRDFLFKDLGVDFCIYDTSPGIQYSSLNAIICSDLIVFIATSDPLDLMGVKETLREFSDIFEGKTLILLNKVFPETDYWPKGRQEEFVNQLSNDFGNPVIEMIPCYCGVLKAKRSQLLTLAESNHPFSEKLEEIAQKLMREE